MASYAKATNSFFMDVAKEICAKWLNNNAKRRYEDELPIVADDMYIVWFCKTLQNWKALVSTDRRNGWYFEVTANGDKKEIYLDSYCKNENRCIKFDEYGIY